MILQEIAEYLQDQGLGLRSSTIFLETTPDKPDVCIVLFTYPGQAGMRTHSGDGVDYERPNLQVKTRGDSLTAFNLAMDVHHALSLVKNMTLSGVRYLSIEPMQSPYQVPADQNGRKQYQLNAQVVKRPS